MKPSRYVFELAAGMTAYAVVLIVSIHLLKTGAPDAAMRPLLALSPMVPVLAVCWTIARALRHMDEMQRKMQFEALGLAFAATAFITFSYGFLEGVGFPKLSMFWVWPLMCGFWLIGVCVNRLRYG